MTDVSRPLESSGNARKTVLCWGGTLLLALLVIAPLAGRSLWLDEAILLVNMPLEGVQGLWAPLPLWEQAGSPLHLRLLSTLAEVPLAAQRVISATLVLGLAFAAWAVWLRGPLGALAAVLGTLGVFRLAVLATELKYYGLEIAGTALCIGWFATKSPRDALRLRDAALLAAAMVMGLTTLVIAPLTLGLHLAWRLARTRRIGLSELGLGAALGGLAGLYYLSIKRVTPRQMEQGIFNDAPGAGLVGPGGDAPGLAERLLAAIAPMREFGLLLFEALRWPGATNGSVMAPMVLATGLALLVCLRQTPVARFVALGAATIVSLVVLHAVNLYPASLPRHMAWFLAFVLAGPVIAVSALAGVGSWPGRGLTALLIGCLALPAATSFRALHADPARIWERTDNGAAIDWLAEAPPGPVAVWYGGQPVVHAYGRWRPELQRHAYFGLIDARDPFRAQPFRGWAAHYEHRLALLHERAAQIVAEAPPATPFHVFASHVEWQVPASPALVSMRHRALVDALAAAGCGPEPVLQSRGVLILRAVCPAADG